jgi:ketose-bisphosphate aldolase
MAMVSMSKLLADARRGGYAVCYCEAWSLESFQAEVEAAEEARSPVIAGFNGGFLMHPGQKRAENLSFYAGLGSSLAKARVPAALILNESKSLTQIEEAIDLGFNAVMVENEGIEMDDYRRLVQQVVAKARPNGVSVEAQAWHLADASSQGRAEPTTPEGARAFVEETGIDALGVAVGNVHIMMTEESLPLDLSALAEIGKAVSVPLVLHGGTGISFEDARRSVRLGVAKVNFGTGLKQAYLAAIAEKPATYHEPMSPHPFIGMGGENDILIAGRGGRKAQMPRSDTGVGFIRKGRKSSGNRNYPRHVAISFHSAGRRETAITGQFR